MITVKTTAHVDDNREVKVQLPENLAPGEYELLIVIDEKSIEKKTKKPLKFANYNYQVAEGETFRREDIYGEDGR
jgi:uncharacterized membrane protein